MGRGRGSIDRALEISPNDEFVIALKVELYQQEGRLDEAAKELARIPGFYRQNVLIHRVDQALLERKFDEAVVWAKKATSSPRPGQALNTQDIFALVLQGYCQLWAGPNEERACTFERVIQEVAPGGVLPLRRFWERGRCLRSRMPGLGDKANALEQAKQGVADYENDAVYQANRRSLSRKSSGAIGRSRCSD